MRNPFRIWIAKPVIEPPARRPDFRRLSSWFRRRSCVALARRTTDGLKKSRNRTNGLLKKEIALRGQVLPAHPADGDLCPLQRWPQELVATLVFGVRLQLQ